MIKNFNELKDKIELLNKLIPSFATDERKEIKKNNKIISDSLDELNVVKNILLEVIREKKQKMIPAVDEKIFENYSLDENTQLDKVKYLSNNSYISKLHIDKNLHEIRYSGSLDKINENITDLINKFLLIGINLTSDDFKYSLFLHKYMSFFFENKNNEEFNKLMATLFESLYWECSNIVYHIYLSFILLLDKHADKFELYIKKCNESYNYDDELNNYFELKKNIDDKIESNEALIYSKFINNEYRIEDYLSGSVLKKEIISKYVDYDSYNNYSFEDRNYFYEKINGMYLDFCEYLDLSKYKFLIEKVREIYVTKSSNEKNFATIKKNIKNLDRQRNNLNSKIFSLQKRINGKTRGMLLNKYNNLINKVNIKITEIIEIYNKFDYDNFVNDVYTKLNYNSSYYDALKIYENNYSYLLEILKENNCDYNEFINFLYNPYLNICKSISFVNEFNIKEKLINKYDLFDMNFNISDESKLNEELKYIIRIWTFDKQNIDLNKIKLIIDINKIKNEEI